MPKKLDQQQLNARKVKRDQSLWRFIGKNKKLIEVNLVDELHEGKPVKDYLNELEYTKSIIFEILERAGCEITSENINDFRSQISDLLLINPNKKYADVSVDETGYIARGVEILGTIVEIDEMPRNIVDDCHKVEDQKVVFDEEKMKEKILL